MLMLAPLTAQVSCGGDDESLGVNNVSPEGSVGGIVVDAATMKPMEGVKATVIAGGKKLPVGDVPTITDASGYFSVQDVPSGGLIVQLTPKDPAAYRGVSIIGAMPSAAGDFPLANATLSLGPIGLLPITDKNAAFTIQMVTPDGAPAPANIKVFARTSVEWVDFHSGSAHAEGLVVVEGATDNSGRVGFAGLPDFQRLAGLVGTGGIPDDVWVRIPPFDSNKDGALDFMGKEVLFHLSRLNESIPTIVLSSDLSPTKLTVTAASIAALAGISGNRMLTSVSGPVYVTYNMPIRQDLTEVSLYDESGKPVVSTPTPSVSGNVLTINLPGLKGGAEYNLNLRTFAEVESAPLESFVGAPIFTPGQAGTTIKATLSHDAGNPNKILVSFNEPIGPGIANKNLTGGNAVIYFDYDIDGSGVKGDAPGERGATSSNIAFSSGEVDPPGPAGMSYLSSYWSFTLPLDSLGNPLPPGTALDILFSNATFSIQRPTGAAVPDLKNLIIP